MDINQLIQLISLAIAAGTNIALAFKHNADGTVDVQVTMTKTQDKLAGDIKQAIDYLASKQTPGGTP